MRVRFVRRAASGRRVNRRRMTGDYRKIIVMVTYREISTVINITSKLMSAHPPRKSDRPLYRQFHWLCPVNLFLSTADQRHAPSDGSHEFNYGVLASRDAASGPFCRTIVPRFLTTARLVA